MTELACSSFLGQTAHPRDLAPFEREECFALLAHHFEGVSREQFHRDLAEKNIVLTLRDASTGKLTGFSTMLVYETSVTGSPTSVVCSGDTVVDPTAWNSPALPREWIAAVNRLRVDYPIGPYYWLLITSGFRTYRLLSTFWQTFYPQHEAAPESDGGPTSRRPRAQRRAAQLEAIHDPTSPPPRGPGLTSASSVEPRSGPPCEQKYLLDTLASERFGTHYNPTTGIVRFDRPQLLRPHLAGIPRQRLTDPHVAFFAQKNPGHKNGDELACLCSLHASNLTRAGRRMVFGAVPDIKAS